MKNICILTSGHPPYDERIYWKFALTFANNGFNTSVICSTMDISHQENGIFIKGFDGENLSKREKINKLKELLPDSDPDIIICCEPLTIIAADKYVSAYQKKCRILADITEWYPENVAFKHSGVKRIFWYLFLYLLNVYTVNKADALIIGEKNKKRRYDLIAPFRQKIIIGYYPVLRFFEYSPLRLNDELVMCYAGLISFERGIKKIVEAAGMVAKKYPALNIRVKFIGKFQKPEEQASFLQFIQKFKNIKVELTGWTSYDKISELLKDVHICFDLRIRNFIYNNSLPIKIFEYMAAGKPFIYSDIRPIREEFNYSACGQLVNPNDLSEICESVEKYIKDRELLAVHQQNGRKIIEQEKNWELESAKLISFISRFLT